MNTPVTKYLLILPASYLFYCFYQDYRDKKAKQQLINKQDPTNSLQHQYSRFNKCRSTLELANIFKKSLKYVRTYITQPHNYYPELVDCQVIDAGQNVGSWFSHPYHTKTVLKINKYNASDNQKSGTFSMLYWTDLYTKKQIRLTNLDPNQEIIKQMLSRRQNKCQDIAKHSMPTSNSDYQRYYIQCIRKSEGQCRALEKELQRIALLKDYRQLI